MVVLCSSVYSSCKIIMNAGGAVVASLGAVTALVCLALIGTLSAYLLTIIIKYKKGRILLLNCPFILYS